MRGGGLAFDLAAWHEVWASRRRCGNEFWRSIVVAGQDKITAHQVLLNDEFDEESFADLARVAEVWLVPLTEDTCEPALEFYDHSGVLLLRAGTAADPGDDWRFVLRGLPGLA